MKLLAVLVLAAACASAQAQAITPNPDAAVNKVAMCQGCHNIANWRASFPEVYRVPMIAGQNAAYIESALKAYRKGDRRHPTMRSVAASLSDQDIADIAAYYQRLGQQAH
ncbi:MAG: cytochrome c [Betaproteobacteria bacterium]|nr:cytochrome c [Betaproteobacteria bacterium]MDE2046782.1 cytochrome c [Betaproteobacteria bacterium]